MNSKRALLEPIFEETSAVTSLFAFRDLSDEEIEAFVIFSESEAGRWYHETTSSVFLETLRETTASLGRHLHRGASRAAPFLNDPVSTRRAIP